MIPTAQADKFYKWVDDQGVTHYTSRPPADKPAKTVNVSSGETSEQQDESPDSKPETNPGPKQAKEPPKPAEPSEAEKQELARIKQKNAEYCEIARRNDYQLNYRDRARVTDPNTGEMRYLTDEELAAERVKAKGQIEQYCNR